MKYLFIMFFVIQLSCQNAKTTESKSTQVSKNVDSSQQQNNSDRNNNSTVIENDAEMEAFLKPYREELKQKTEAVIGKLNIDLVWSKNSTLGRFAAMVMLEKSREYSKINVDFSVLNNGGLRREIYKGDLRIKDIYELMPFDNYIVVLSLNGEKTQKVCEEIFKHKLSIANLKIIYNKKTKDIKCFINDELINIDKTYYISTINYLYSVGEGVPTLKQAKMEKEMMNKLFRDAIIEYVTSKKVIETLIEPQIITKEK